MTTTTISLTQVNSHYGLITSLLYAGGQTLEFRDPATQAVLWTQSLSLSVDFAGKLT